MKYCPKCGAGNRDEERFCKECLHRLSWKPANLSWKALAIAVGSLMLLILGYYPMSAPKDMVLIPAGKFWMGSAEGVGETDEHPRHKVWVDAFYMDKYEVTFEKYDYFCEKTGRTEPEDEGCGRGSWPVINIDWKDASAYCKWAGKRLPTEAEWEKAARGGTDTKWSFGDDEGRLGEYAWYSTNSGGETHPVGQKKPNPFGLFDMHGNVWEWCADWYGENYYASSLERNPKGPDGGQYRVLRDGSWTFDAYVTRSASRGGGDPGIRHDGIGCRCARTP